jgi:hypothetical protein
MQVGVVRKKGLTLNDGADVEGVLQAKRCDEAVPLFDAAPGKDGRLQVLDWTHSPEASQEMEVQRDLTKTERANISMDILYRLRYVLCFLVSVISRIDLPSCSFGWKNTLCKS